MWGAGVRGPIPDSNPSSHDDYSAPWGLTHLFRRDVEQADVAALMSTLLGVDWPANSVGVLPDVDHTRSGYLRLPGAKDKAKAALVNAKVCLCGYVKSDRKCGAEIHPQVLLEHYRVKHSMYFAYITVKPQV